MGATPGNASAASAGRRAARAEQMENGSFRIQPADQRLRLVLEQLPAVIWSTDADLRFTSSCGSGLEHLRLKANEVVGQTLAEYFGSTECPVLAIEASKKALAGQSSAFEQQWQGNYYHCYVEPLRDDSGEIIGTVGVAHDITQQKATESELRKARAELEEKVAERTKELRTANRILREDLIERTELGKRLRASEDRFRGIAEGLPIPVAIARISDGRFLYVNQRFERDFAATTSSGDRTAIDFFEDESDWQRLLQMLDSEGFVQDQELQARRGDGSPAWVSLSLQRMTFDDEDAVLAGFLDVSARRAVQEDLERQHRMLQRSLNLHDRDQQVLAYEIHDGLVQDLTAAVMYLQSCQSRQNPAKTSELLEKAARLVQGTINEARRIINGLRPPVLEEQGLVAALENLVDEIEATADLTTRLDCDVQFNRFAPALEMAIYRIVQEALNNVWKHSQSHLASVELRQKGGQIFIRIEDQGAGFDLQAVSSRCYGLRGIRERAKLLGGRADIRSAPGEGTTINVRLPVAESIPPGDDSVFPDK